MTVKELIAKLNTIENKDAEIILEDSILGLAVRLTFIREKSCWAENSIDLCGDIVPEEEEEEE